MRRYNVHLANGKVMEVWAVSILIDESNGQVVFLKAGNGGQKLSDLIIAVAPPTAYVESVSEVLKGAP